MIVRKEVRTESPSRSERFRVIYEANYSRILGYAARRTNSPEDASDVVAETFLTAWRRLDDVPDGADARLWLYGVARRVLSNHRRGIRRGRRLQAALQADLSIDRPSVEVDVRMSRVAEAFGRLRVTDRDLLGLVAWEGLSSPELARVLGCSAGAARLRVHRARGRLLRQLARQGVEVEQRTRRGHVTADGHPPVPAVEERW
jgi:RNA polymerase sigma-70 factor (ECF subfamily)